MPNFESPISRKQIKTQPMKEFNVPDETGYVPPQEQHMPAFNEADFAEFERRANPAQNMRQITDEETQIAELKRQKREGKERLSEGARRRIEMLIGMTRLTRDVEVDGQLYRLQSLKSKELSDALVAAAEFSNSVRYIFEMRKQLLARSLVVVAGVEMSQFLNSDELGARLDFIDEIDHALLLRLYGEYVSVANDAQTKYAIKTAEEAKEIVDDLKKS